MPLFTPNRCDLIGHLVSLNCSLELRLLISKAVKQKAPKWLAECLPYTQVHQDSWIKAELKKTVHIISAVTVARKRLETKEKPPTQLVSSELQYEVGFPSVHADILPCNHTFSVRRTLARSPERSSCTYFNTSVTLP